jgi:hypothetical protein
VIITTKPGHNADSPDLSGQLNTTTPRSGLERVIGDGCAWLVLWGVRNPYPDERVDLSNVAIRDNDDMSFVYHEVPLSNAAPGRSSAMVDCRALQGGPGGSKEGGVSPYVSGSPMAAKPGRKVGRRRGLASVRGGLILAALVRPAAGFHLFGVNVR